MEMESSRRPFSRSNDQALKKPRLADDRALNPNPNGRAFAQRPGGANPVLSRFTVSDRDPESNDPNRGGGGYVPQPLQHQELVSQYKTALAELTFNSKPIITNLTIIAGENLLAAKAIAATICSHVIEVPTEQKLPSLYLLDSIVKNIGRDYIKYFAVRLPEVFCRAYKQVEPPLHQSMRHLFGTWKGVFPAQTLLMIEKELGFTSTANGTSSGAAAPRPDSQSQRQAQSIHVNPKYLERQRLQQSSSHVNTDALNERVPEKNIGAEYGEYEYGSDPPRNSILGSRRVGGKIPEQGLDKPWYGGGISVAETISSQRNGVNIKRGLTNYSATKSANADPRLKTAQGIASRNSGGLSSSWKNSEEEEFMWDDMNSRLIDRVPNDVSCNSRKDLWTSDDSGKLGSGDHFRIPKNANNYASTVEKQTSADPIEQKGLPALRHRISSPWGLQESHGVDVRTPSGTPPVSSAQSVRYASNLSGLSTSGDSYVAKSGSQAQIASCHIGASGFGVTAASASTGALGKPHLLRSVRAASPSGQSLHQPSPSPTITVHHPYHHLQNSAEQDHPQDLSLPSPVDSLPIPNPNVRLARIAKSHSQDQSSSLSMPAIQSRHPNRFRRQQDNVESESLGQAQKPLVPQVSTSVIPDKSKVLAAETSVQLTSSLLAAVMKTGILSDKSVTGSLPNSNFRDVANISSQSAGVQPPLPSRCPPNQVASAPLLGQFSRENSPASSNISQKKLEPMPIAPDELPCSSLEGIVSENASTVVNNALDPISNLLSSLVAKGLISSSKSEPPALVASKIPTELQNKRLCTPTTSLVSVSQLSVPPSLPASSQTDDASISETVAKTSAALPQSTKIEARNLIGFEFKPDKIREFNPSVISELFDDLPHICNICGLRLKLKERLERHLEWHASKDPEANDSVSASRRWFLESTSWVSGGAGPLAGSEPNNSTDKRSKTMDNEEPMVVADESQCACVICGDIFEDFYCQERDAWMFKGASYMSMPFGVSELGTIEESVVKGPIVHAKCIAESSVYDLGLTSKIKLEIDV